MRVDIWSDVVCPWCYIGKARFEKSLSEFAHRDEVEVTFRSFELDPARPNGEHETVLYMLTQKYGMPAEQARQEDWTHEDYLAAVLAREVAAREASGANIRTRAAGFPARKTLTDFNFDHQVAADRGQIHRLAAGAVTGGPGDPPRHEPGSRETALVESGKVVLHCDGQRFELLDGDCVTFDADLTHHFENPGPDEAVLLAVLSAGLRRS